MKRRPELLTASCIVALLAGVIVTILYAAGVARHQTPAIAFLLGSVALATGLPAIVQRTGNWGVPGDGS